jgi:hypothetical protein
MNTNAPGSAPWGADVSGYRVSWLQAGNAERDGDLAQEPHVVSGPLGALEPAEAAVDARHRLKGAGHALDERRDCLVEGLLPDEPALDVMAPAVSPSSPNRSARTDAKLARAVTWQP